MHLIDGFSLAGKDPWMLNDGESVSKSVAESCTPNTKRFYFQSIFVASGMETLNYVFTKRSEAICSFRQSKCYTENVNLK